MYHLSFMAPGIWHKMGITTDGHWPCVYTLCLPDVSALDQISKAFPSLYLHNANNQMLEVGMAWEWGYMSVLSHLQHLKIILFECVYIVNSCCSLLMNATSAVNILDNDVDCIYFTTHFSIHHQTTIHCELLVKSYWAILTSLITDVFCCTCTFHFVWSHYQ